MNQRRAVEEALSAIPYPGFSRDILSLGAVAGIEIGDGQVSIRIKLEQGQKEHFPALKEAILDALREIEGVDQIDVTLVAAGPRRLPVAGQTEEAAPAAPEPEAPIASNIIGIASGKGGVGKSTVAVNVAVALARAGRRVGFLDADVHGPSAPLMFGLEGRKPEQADSSGRPLPIEACGVKVMSMGFFVERDNAVIWRGPIVGNFIKQLLTDVAWGELDDLVIDFPPGTGDAQLTISQTLKMDGAVVVTTPNDLALIDALKAINMFRKVEVPILGIVENMAWFSCPGCGEKSEIFGRGGAARASRDHSVPLVGQVPIDPQVVEDTDRGKPVVIERPDSECAAAYRAIAEAILATGEKSQRAAKGGLGAFLGRFGGGGS